MNTATKAVNDAPKTSYRLELENGELPQPAIYLRRIMAGQDIEAWKANPAKLNAWLRSQMAEYMQRVSVVFVSRI